MSWYYTDECIVTKLGLIIKESSVEVQFAAIFAKSSAASLQIFPECSLTFIQFVTWDLIRIILIIYSIMKAFGDFDILRMFLVKKLLMLSIDARESIWKLITLIEHDIANEAVHIATSLALVDDG